DLDPASLVERVRDAPEMEGADLAAEASCGEPYDAASIVGMVTTGDHRTFRVAAYDFGIKRNILRLLHQHGCDTTVFPATTPAEDVLREGFDGVFLSNGPGDPAATTYGIDACRQLLGKVPIFGICLGHQLMARALGGNTYKMKFGHRGVNQPVIDLTTGRIEITSHNHGFAVAPTDWTDVTAPAPGTPGTPPLLASGHSGPAPSRATADAPRGSSPAPRAGAPVPIVP